MRKFLEPSEKPKVIYTDNSLELANLVKIYHGIIVLQHASSMWDEWEQCTEKKEGTSAVLLPSGLDEQLWAASVESCCHLRNVQDLLAPYERRCAAPCEGTVIPCGAMVAHHPISATDQSRLHRCGKKVLPGIFGCAVIVGCIWEGKIMVADIELGKFGCVRNPGSKARCKRRG